MKPGRTEWTAEERVALAEARSKLQRSVRVNAIVAMVGVFITVGTLALRAGAFIVAYAVIECLNVARTSPRGPT